MTILKLAIDASQAKQGAREAEQAVDQFGRSAERAGKAVDSVAKEVGRSLDVQADKAKNFSRTVEAVGEVTQISQRVRLLGEEVRNLGSGMSSAASIGQTLSGTLIDIAQISGKVEGGFGGFVTLLRANPLLVAATVIGGIATAMSLFSGETKEANAELQKQIQLQEELRKTGVDLALQIQRTADLQRLGFPVDANQLEIERAKQLAQVASGLAGQPGTQSISDLQTLTGLSYQDITRLARPGLVNIAPPSRLTGGFYDLPDPNAPEILAVTNEAARKILLDLALALRVAAQSADVKQAFAATGKQYAPEPGPGFTGILTPQQIAEIQRRSRDQGPGFSGILNERQIAQLVRQQEAVQRRPEGPGFSLLLSQEQIAEAARRQQAQSRQQGQLGEGFNLSLTQLAIEQAEKRVKEFNERLREMKELGQDVGSAIGGAFFQIVNGAASARQALAALLQSFVAIAQQRAIQGIASSIGNAFGSTVQQTNANTSTNVRVPSTAGGGISGGGLA